MTLEAMRRLSRLGREAEHERGRAARLQAAADRERRRYAESLRKWEQQRGRLAAYLDGVDDRQMRQILTLRYLDGLTWWEVADRIGGGNTADGVRMAHVRYLQRH